MSMTITFTIDEDFTTEDLMVMVKYQEIAHALHEMQYHLQRIGRGKELTNIDKMSSQEFLNYLISYIEDLIQDLPDLSCY